ncbi:MAG: ASKHA domain-containing protein, partial [Anaerovoracaceae bacterium]
LQLLADGRQIGIEVRGTSILVPLKSCGGIFFVSHEEIEKPSKECEECRGTIISCNLCSVRQEKRKVFKCTGVCSKCGRCKDSAMIAGANKRKTKLLALPSDFVPETDEPGYGIAFDIGTTTVVGMLWDIKNGKELGAKAMTNPQNKYGLDVISRITFGNEDKTNLVTMRTEIVACLNDIIDELCQSSGIEKEGIIRATVGGNTTMSHLFAGYDPATLAKAPFAPAYTGTLMMTGESSMLKIHPKGDVMLFPNIAGHVGGDITAGIIASRLFDEKELTLFIDIGTNGEIALTDQGRTLACSTAAGPAFEGAAIHQGMRAAPGAIEKLTITDEDVFFTTIDGVRPVGICGSGLIDAISELWSYGLIKKTGRLLSKEELEKKKPETKIAERLREGSSGREFVLIFKEDEEDIVITQNDIREVQLAKGAISAGITIMLEKLEKTEQDIHKIIVAGAFGNFINKESAVNMGLLPKVSLDRIYSAGNTAGAGTLMALASSKEALLAKKVPELVEHVELSSCEDFQTKYLTAMAFV